MEREAKRQYLEDQTETAADRNAALDVTIEDLGGILAQTLNADDRIDFNSLRVSEKYPNFSPPPELTRATLPPELEQYTSEIQPPGFLARLIPGAEERHQEKLRAASAQFESALANYRFSEEKRVAGLHEAQKEYEEKRLAAIEAEKRRAQEEEQRRLAEIEAKAQAEREHEERIRAMEALEIEQKARRDARYAARKAQKKKGR